MKKFEAVRKDLYDKHDVEFFTNTLTEHTANGYEIESCGIGGDTCRMGWAILSKKEPDKPKKMDVLDAVKLVAETCKKHMDNDLGCIGCPLDGHNQCLASGALLPAYWLITKEE